MRCFLKYPSFFFKLRFHCQNFGKLPSVITDSERISLLCIWLSLKYWWAWVQNGVSVRGKRRVLMFLFFLWGSREKLFVCVYFIYTILTRWGDNVILVSLHSTSDTNRSHAWMTQTWARKPCRTTPDNTDIIIQLIFWLHWRMETSIFFKNMNKI